MADNNIQPQIWRIQNNLPQPGVEGQKGKGGVERVRAFAYPRNEGPDGTPFRVGGGDWLKVKGTLEYRGERRRIGGGSGDQVMSWH